MKIPGVPADSEMVMMEYIGTSIGSKTWGGAGGVPSGRYYRFGSNHKDKVKYVERQDVPTLLGLRQDSKELFRVYPLPDAAPRKVPSTEEAQGDAATKPVEVQPAPKLVEAPGSIGGEVGVSGSLSVKVQRKVPPAENLTVADIKEMDLSREQWQTLLEQERKGKHRITVITYVEDLLHGKVD